MSFAEAGAVHPLAAGSGIAGAAGRHETGPPAGPQGWRYRAPLRGFGLDRLPSARLWLIKQTKADCDRWRLHSGEKRPRRCRGTEIILERWVIGWYNYS